MTLYYRSPEGCVVQRGQEKIFKISILNNDLGRIIDASFGSTHSNASIGSAYGLPDTYMRVYYLDSGVMERFATISSDIWDQTWQRMWPSLQPDSLWRCRGGSAMGKYRS